MHSNGNCGSNDIVVVVGQGQDSFAGRQTFKILNSVYQNTKIQYVTSRYLVRTPIVDKFYIGNSQFDKNA